MDRNSPYSRQVQLLVQLLPLVASESCFALKGGTAINLFIRELPRLSVDIDLVYLPEEDRDTALKAIADALNRVASEFTYRLKGTHITKSYENKSDSLRLVVERDRVTVKIELSPVFRGTVYDPKVMAVVARVEDEFGYAEVPVVSFEDLYAGKICAALDRQHPRDLFDVKLLLEKEGLTERLRKALLIYLISHSRPMEELLAPRFKDLRPVYYGEFQGMTLMEISLSELEGARVRLLESIIASLTDDEKRFLFSVYELDPDIAFLGLDGVLELPAVRWKLQNIERMSSSKRESSLRKLKLILNIPSGIH